MCPHCGLVHCEFAFVFQPRQDLAKTVAKALSDGLRGVLVFPFTTSDTVWSTLSAASLTCVQGQLNPSIIIRASPAYLPHIYELFCAQSPAS